jgi:membrane protease YdiL (CAAX protease family)
VIRAVASGLIISIVVGSSAYPSLAKLNARFHPDLPWAAALSLAWLILTGAWLNGCGWPRSTRDFRHHSLRLWRPPQPWTSERTISVIALMAMICAIYAYYIVAVSLMGGRPPPDLSAYPTTASRFSAIIMGALLSGAAEEMAFRGYMQSQLERFGPVFAIVVTSIAFMLAHAPQDLHQFVRLAVGYFVLALLWGTLARRAGTILPGMVLHVTGDLLVAYFIVLGGNGNLLFAN